MTVSLADRVTIRVETQYMEAQSEPDNNKFVFAYTVTIENQGNTSVQLLHRHWLITDADGKKTEVKGPGVVGEQPVIDPNNSYQYTSGTVLETPVGIMQGSYTLKDGEQLSDVDIPTFRLSIPNILH